MTALYNWQDVRVRRVSLVNGTQPTKRRRKHVTHTFRTQKREASTPAGEGAGSQHSPL